jgi:hypothetical protein
MRKTLTAFLLLTWGILSFAEPASIVWPTRNTKVVCGGDVDGRPLQMRVVIANELLAGESENGRILIYIDLHKPAQVRWVFSDTLTDDQYAKREAALAKLSTDEANLLRALTGTRETDLYMGMTDGFVTLRTTSKGQSMSVSCQEIAISD